jgi:hypothetical protein
MARKNEINEQQKSTLQWIIHCIELHCINDEKDIWEKVKNKYIIPKPWGEWKSQIKVDWEREREKRRQKKNEKERIEEEHYKHRK